MGRIAGRLSGVDPALPGEEGGIAPQGEAVVGVGGGCRAHQHRGGKQREHEGDPESVPNGVSHSFLLTS
jgi:hypothetical protein